ncbi:MAG: SCP2 sterol-binding domain-containing protein [Thiomonas sp.]|uniref:ubiquinone biosynthesis accessory factor UbiJ n=1 Tax=Thiomonas sp. TaxID=2047785 RepID=UPI002A361C5D|nr:SCP2 sterol-binding domain-containing protein [Thiomonas sp.]MDY0330096.1 SCP2 sterol-binding domain-containing protein [Thiomonas sp.]
MRIPDIQPRIPDRTSLVRRLQDLVLPALNHLLAADPHAQGKLRAHAGKTVVFAALGLDMAWTIEPAGLLRIATSASPGHEDADLHITLDLDALREAIAKRAPLNLSGARVSGDAELAQTLSWLMAHVRWDAEDDLAQLIGDIPAHRISRAGQGLVTTAQQTWTRAQNDARDWFAASPRALVSRGEWAQMQQAVSELRDQAARLEKRLALLRRQLGAREN